MSITLKCPNPSCPYLFDPSRVPAGVVLACPRCTTRFTLGNYQQQANAPQAPADQGQGAAVSAPATTRIPPFGAELAFSEMTPETARPDGYEGPLLPVRSSQLQTVLLVGVAAVALAGAAVAVWYKLTHKPEETRSDPAIKFLEKNFSLEAPPSPWIEDGSMQATLGSPYLRVYKRENPEAYMAFGARDYNTLEPRTTELKQNLLIPLSRLLAPRTLNQQAIPPNTTWFSAPVQGFNFRAQLKSGAAIEGEAYYVSHKGIGYWFLAWAGENEMYAEQKGTFAKTREQCKWLDLRKDWTSKHSNVVPFKNNVLGYTILDGEGIWLEEMDEERIKAEDPKADKYLTAKIRQKGDDFANEADLVILLLDSMGDPLEQARAYIERRENADVENRGKSTFQPHVEDSSFDEPNAVEGNAPYVLLKSKNTTSGVSRLWAISAIKVGEKTIVACAKCLFSQDDREQFERKFVVLVRSLRGGG
jgi:hypothetical protein